jgi:hypothetical protein
VPTTSTSISYVFNALAGALDHAVVTPNLAQAVAVRKWNINAQEPTFLEYDVAGAATDTLSPFRSSDHDPVLIGVRFAGFAVSVAPPTAPARWGVFPNPTTAGFRLTLPVAAAAEALTFAVYAATGQRLLTVTAPATALSAEVARRSASLPPGVYWVRIEGADYGPALRVVKE